MIEILKEKINSVESREEKINIVREFLQVLILKIMRDKNAFLNIAFVGGTALRILYKLKRFSEDLDFSLISKKNYDFINILQEIKKETDLYNLPIEIKYKTGVVNSCFIKFKNVLQSLELDKHRDEKVSIKLEIDTNPPTGAKIEEKIINDHFIFDIRAYDLSSLMSGKLHAVLTRKYSKGRDFYDLIWYLTNEVKPNVKFLNNALIQTQKESWNLTEENWKEKVFNKIKGLDYKKIQNDVERFLARKEEVTLINIETYKKLLSH